MCSEGYCTWFVCPCVCVSVCVCVCVSVSTYSRPTGTKLAHQRYQRLQRNKGSKNYVAILLKRRRSRDMALKQATKPPTTTDRYRFRLRWNIGSLTMERREYSNDDSVSVSPWHGCTVGSS